MDLPAGATMIQEWNYVDTNVASSFLPPEFFSRLLDRLIFIPKRFIAALKHRLRSDNNVMPALDAASTTSLLRTVKAVDRRAKPGDDGE
ncbi:MAG: hypothetical protein EXR02_03130 [Rhodospirillales bacterium]|nr:hypothetical protein [Rhodospirillales bacterium]